MSQFMNDYDIESARRRFTRAACPNRLALAITVERLAEWTNNHSDGWAYWAKPRNAADRAMTLINSTTSAANDAQEDVDATDAEVAAAMKPIKAFLTRQAREIDRFNKPRVTVWERELILRATATPAFEVL